jgi:DNA-binding transcriptional ArsR family regulator
MRNQSPLDALFSSTRQRILAATLLSPQKWWYQSDLAKHLGVRPSSLQRELAAMAEAGILRLRREGNRRYFQPDPLCPFLDDLTGLLLKTAGLVDVLRQSLQQFASQIVVSFVYGSVAKHAQQSGSDIDLMIVGQVKLSQVAPALKRAEAKLGRPVNPTMNAPAELVKKLAAGHHFLESVLREPKLFVIGGEHELEAIVGKRSRKAAPNEQIGARRAAVGRRT